MSFKPPKEYDFSAPEQWRQWRQRFLRYRSAAKLERENNTTQVSALIYSMGPEAEKLVKPLTENSPFEEVVKHFDNHFIPKVNVIHERAKFHLCIQQQEENIETYVRRLYDLAEYANFDNKEETIRDL